MTTEQTQYTDEEKIDAYLAFAAECWTDALKETGLEAVTDIGFMLDSIRKIARIAQDESGEALLARLPLPNPPKGADVNEKLRQSFMEAAAEDWKLANLAVSPKTADRYLESMIVNMQEAGLSPQEESDLLMLPTDNPLAAADFRDFKEKTCLRYAASIIRNGVGNTGDRYNNHEVSFLMEKAKIDDEGVVTGSWARDGEKLLALFSKHNVGIGLSPVIGFSRPPAKEYGM